MANIQDLKEFKAELSKACKYNINPNDLSEIFDVFGEALGRWINMADKHEDDHWHGQQHGGINLKMRLVPESIGHGVAEGEIIEEHYAVYVTLSKKALDGMSDVLGKPVKNG